MRLRISFFVIVITVLLAAACSQPEPTSTPELSPTEAAESETAVPDEEEAEPETAVPTPSPEPTEEPEETAEATAEPVTESQFPAAPIANEEGGPVSISGVVTYTNPFFTLGVASPVVILEDQAGFVDRNESFLMPVESQTLGQITSDFYDSPFTYSIALPIEPQGTLRDVDNDGEEDTGVQVYAVAYWNNIFGDPFLEERDLSGGGWSTAYASTEISEEAETEKEIVGGKLLVYAADDQQGFPSGFGDDGLLFTEDDPVVALPQGYTVVDLDADPFTFDRSRDQVIDLIEPEGAALVDYSELSYSEAFDGLVEQLSREYAFTEYKGIDWEALHAAFRPRFEEAEAEEDSELYRRALRDFAWSIPDGHVSGPFLNDDFRNSILGGIGLAIRELDDGRVLVNFLLEDGPADRAGIEMVAEILAMNGTPIGEVISNTLSYFGPYSTPHTQRLDQLLFATRFAIGTEVEVTFRNPDSSAQQTAELTAESELESYFFWLEDEERDGFELPVEYDILEENSFGYVRIFSFQDNDLLTVQLWERMIRSMKENEVPAIIIDMRLNGGGRGFLADQMAAYFFEEPFVLGSTGRYHLDRGEFYFDPRSEQRFYLPSEDLRYDGEVVVIVGPQCASACEFFSYDMTLQDRATIVGHYPTAGLGGSIDQVAMPEDESFTFTQGRAVNAEGEIHIEGIGVVPDVVVPVTEETLFSEDDPVLAAAVRHLAGELVEGNPVIINDVITHEISPGTRVQHLLTLSGGDVVSIILESESEELELILSIYDENGNLLAATEPDSITGFEGIEIPSNVTFLLEISTPDNAGEGGYTLSIVDESD